MRFSILMLAILSGCSSVPVVDGTGTLTCVHVVTLTTTSTTVYIASGQSGTLMLQPDCTMAVQLAPRGVGL